MANLWKGRHYDVTRLLLLGESSYSWHENGKLRHPSPHHSSDIVKWVIDDFEGHLGNMPFMITLSRALANEQCPSRDRLRFVWSRVAFANYVTDSVGVGARIPPSAEMWKKAEREFPALLDRLAPSRVIVLGKRMWERMPPTDIEITKEVQGYRLVSGRTAMCWALKHPARGLSWRELAAIVHFSYWKQLQG
jgi:hypothetical protein